MIETIVGLIILIIGLIAIGIFILFFVGACIIPNQTSPSKEEGYVFVDDDGEELGEEHAGLLAENEEEESEALFW